MTKVTSPIISEPPSKNYDHSGMIVDASTISDDLILDDFQFFRICGNVRRHISSAEGILIDRPADFGPDGLFSGSFRIDQLIVQSSDQTNGIAKLLF